MTVDRDRLRRLALVARDDDQAATMHLAMTPGEAELAQALDPETVLELLGSEHDQRVLREAMRLETARRRGDESAMGDALVAVNRAAGAVLDERARRQTGGESYVEREEER